MIGRGLAVFAGVGNVIVALAIGWSIGTLSQSPAWEVMEQAGVPPWIWAAYFFIAGAIQVIGGVCIMRRVAATGFYLAGFMMFLWAVATLVSGFTGLATIRGAVVGTVFLGHIGIMKVCIAYYIQQHEAVVSATEDIINQARSAP